MKRTTSGRKTTAERPQAFEKTRGTSRDLMRNKIRGVLSFPTIEMLSMIRLPKSLLHSEDLQCCKVCNQSCGGQRM
ncbi:hypothetical protein RRG08_012204 [Elysia crispata]|uniref:Uncharacterized protein n=1 Tax=Elysia crispata TaxID=231223 RepID=A0AAE0ZKI9_9GAST|nr:hypothetical protein RRG08_012204 [Elysia crispata]